MEYERIAKHKFCINKSNGRWISLESAKHIKQFVRPDSSLNEFLKEYLLGNYIIDFYKGFRDNKQQNTW